MSIVNRIAELREQREWSMAELGRRVGCDASTINKLEKGHTRLSTDWLSRLAEAFGVDEAEIIGKEPRRRSAERAADAALTPYPATVPVRGTAAGSLGEGAMLVDKSGPVAWVQRPPGIMLDRDVYALHVTGTSMEPRYYDGELIYATPARAPRVGDHVVIYIQNYRGAAQTAYLKRYRGEIEGKLVAEQYNPQATIRFSPATVTGVHRVLTLNELFGI